MGRGDHRVEQEQKMHTPTTLEITVISAEDLRVGDRCVKDSAFVTVRTDGTDDHDTTSLDFEGGSYTWNEKLTLSLPSFTRSIVAEVQCRKRSGSKTVGRAMIPVSDFREPANYLHFLSYRLKGMDGNPNGIINLSIRVN